MISKKSQSYETEQKKLKTKGAAKTEIWDGERERDDEQE